MSKVKIAVFCAGFERHSCWFLDWGDVLATEFRPEFDEENLTGSWAGAYTRPLLSST
jgi:hypothetical protein